MADAPGGPKFGRRAAIDESAAGGGGGGDAPKPVMKGWGEETAPRSDFDQPTLSAGGHGGTLDQVELPTIDGGIDEAAAGAAAAARGEEDETMGKEVAAAPVEYHSAMPKLSELDAGVRWAKALARAGSADGVDLSCLTSALCQHLDDEDVAWNPDLLLVQLTSEMLDVVEKRDDEHHHHQHQQPLGQQRDPQPSLQHHSSTLGGLGSVPSSPHANATPAALHAAAGGSAPGGGGGDVVREGRRRGAVKQPAS